MLKTLVFCSHHRASRLPEYTTSTGHSPSSLFFPSSNRRRPNTLCLFPCPFSSFVDRPMPHTHTSVPSTNFDFLQKHTRHNIFARSPTHAHSSRFCLTFSFNHLCFPIFHIFHFFNFSLHMFRLNTRVVIPLTSHSLSNQFYLIKVHTIIDIDFLDIDIPSLTTVNSKK